MKHESHTRSRRVCLPSTSVWSVASQQKQVGQTWVQLAQDRQRLPTSAPAFGIQVLGQQAGQVAGIHAAAHLAGGLFDGLVGGGLDEGRGQFEGPAGQQAQAQLRADFHQEQIIHFGQAQVETGLVARAGAHRDAEAGGVRVQAVDRQDEQSLAAGAVDRVVEIRAQEDPVLDADGSQFAGAHTDQGVMRGRGVVLL